jgi:hypothetical protein
MRQVGKLASAEPSPGLGAMCFAPLLANGQVELDRLQLFEPQYDVKLAGSLPHLDTLDEDLA